jgi:hypothetical protein
MVHDQAFHILLENLPWAIERTSPICHTGMCSLGAVLWVLALETISSTQNNRNIIKKI